MIHSFILSFIHRRDGSSHAHARRDAIPIRDVSPIDDDDDDDDRTSVANDAGDFARGVRAPTIGGTVEGGGERRRRCRERWCHPR